MRWRRLWLLATGEKRQRTQICAEFGELQSRIRALNGESAGEERARQLILALLVLASGPQRLPVTSRTIGANPSRR